MSLSEEEFAKLFNNVDGIDVNWNYWNYHFRTRNTDTPILFLIMINHSAKKVNLIDEYY